MADDVPTPPPDLPEYVRDGLEARSPEELRAVADWAESMAAHRERELAAELERPPDEDGTVAGTNRYEAADLADEVEESDLSLDDATGSVYLYWIRTHCNKSNCSSCPHGPYPYIKYRVGDAVRTRYGKTVADALGVGPPE